MSKTNSVIFIISTLLLLERADSLAASNDTCPNCVPSAHNDKNCGPDEMPCTANGINYCCFNQPPLKK